MERFNEKKNIGERMKQRIAKTASDMLTTRAIKNSPCTVIMLGEPEMPIELFEDDAEIK